MEQEIYLSVVIPAYNEEKRIDKILSAIRRYESDCNFNIEVIITDDGSKDNTIERAKELCKDLRNAFVIERKENKGKGYTVKEGILKASGKYILFADADNSTPFYQIDKLLKFVPEYKVVIGSRYCRDGKLARPQPFYRILGSRGLNLVIQLLACRGVKDTQCGFKLFEHNAAKEIFKRETFNRFSFDIEVLAIARKLNYKIKEVGIIWYDDPHSTVNPIKDGMQVLKDSWKVRQNIIARKYK